MDAKASILNVIHAITIDKSATLWDAVTSSVVYNALLLQNANVVAVFKERTANAQVECREISLHNPPRRAFGFELLTCGKEGCGRIPYSMPVIGPDGWGRFNFECSTCGWTSRAVSSKEVESYVHLVHSRYPFVYWHDYPPHVALSALFL
ncbi:hypothetical protein V8B97DRAFT_523895 [Scleroderma yunnanense]